MKRFVLAVSIAALLGAFAPAHAAVNAAIAGPAADPAGFATPTMVLSKSAPAVFINADPVSSPHNIVSVEEDEDGDPWFASDTGGPGVYDIVILPDAPEGELEFLCTVHPDSMTGVANIVA